MAARVRVGIVGAGNFTTNRMLPNFQKLPDVEITVVANRSRESAERVATCAAPCKMLPTPVKIS